MKSALRIGVLLLAVAALPAEGQIDDITRYNMRPLIQLHAVGSDIAGGSFETDVFIYQGGPVFLAYTAATGNACRVERGVATPQHLMDLNRALAASRVGQQRGGCGSPAPDYVSAYALTWYGKQRVKTITAGGNYTDCPADVQRIFNATCEFIWDVLGPAPEVCVPHS
ncbi:MAG TPA: hypothetical protein VF789_02120 [Thermoanaerobaculia bacterium]